MGDPYLAGIEMLLQRMDEILCVLISRELHEQGVTTDAAYHDFLLELSKIAANRLVDNTNNNSPNEESE